ncbi:hypothetical protein [Dolichospermum sp. FACHB-1091]|uniref:hypothetical protein n=1 Tax=Dolichospermum sp. FACHB-1091 TaxID=2692798 RepID=UPI0016809061|nr:hypothetical protein [Dolichospermum sp. FACHB-1091]
MKLTLSRLFPLVVGSAAAGVLASSSPAKAVVLTVNNVDYHVESVTDTYNNLKNRLTNTPWYQKPYLAKILARHLGELDQLGRQENLLRPKFMWFSPFFLFSAVPAENNTLSAYAFNYLDIPNEYNLPKGVASNYVPNAFDLKVTYVVQSVPWEISGRTTIPAVGALLLAARWKARKSIASKTRTANPDVAVR